MCVFLCARARKCHACRVPFLSSGRIVGEGERRAGEKGLRCDVCLEFVPFVCDWCDC